MANEGGVEYVVFIISDYNTRNNRIQVVDPQMDGKVPSPVEITFRLTSFNIGADLPLTDTIARV